MDRPLLAALLAWVLTGLTACVNHELVSVELGGPRSPPDCHFPARGDVDVLFVIDNSSSMAGEQAKLARSFGAFVETLERVDANYRVGVTTTDNANPLCDPAATTPEGGNLVLRSCRERLDAFVSASGEIDARALACEDLCSLDAAALEIQPSRIDSELGEAPRPWLERIDGRSNLPEGTSVTDAFACFGPQGIDGCDFESPLESMYLALIRAQTPGEASYGFMRAGAKLVIVIVTDEVDCSHNKQFSDIFDADGAKVFWSDPEAEAPSSALCWRAGVSCFEDPAAGDPGSYEACVAVNKDVTGQEWVADEDAVLHPMRRYHDLLDGIELAKRQLDPNAEVSVALIAGVGGDGQPIYREGEDPAFEAEYGVGPGCEAPDPSVADTRVALQAVPPVRLRELAERHGSDNMFSICEADYEDALAQVAEALDASIAPACFTQCVADLDPETPTLEPECLVRGRWSDGSDDFTIPECLRDGGAYVVEDGDYVMPEADDEACHLLRSDDPDAPLTPSTSDDMSPECVDANFNLEFEIVRRPGASDGRSLVAKAICGLADFPAIDCPGIGG